jgi:putrescine transport system substrate-binding protein
LWCSFVECTNRNHSCGFGIYGEDPSTTDPEVLKKAEPVLDKIRPYIQKFHSSQYIDSLANGDICLVVGWSGDIFMAQYAAWDADNGVEIVYSIPVKVRLCV